MNYLTIVSRWASMEWHNSRKCFMESLGHRTQNWMASSSAGGVNAAYGESIGNRSFDTNVIQTPVRNKLLLANSPYAITPSIASSTTKAKQISTVQSQNQQRMAHIQQHGQTDLIRSHAAIIHKLNVSTANKSNAFNSYSTNAAFDTSSSSSLDMGLVKYPITEYINQIDEYYNPIIQSNNNNITHLSPSSDYMKLHNMFSYSDIIGYKNCLEMLSYMTGEKSNQGHNSGYFAPCILDHPEISSEIISHCKELLCCGTLQHYEIQYESVILNNIKKNANMLSTITGNAMTNAGVHRNKLSNIRLYVLVKLYLSQQSNAPYYPKSCLLSLDDPLTLPNGVSRHISSISGNNGGASANTLRAPIWPQIYYLLRTGSLIDAKELIELYISDNIIVHEKCVLVVIEGLLEMMDESNNNSSNRNSSEGGHVLTRTLRAMSTCCHLFQEYVVHEKHHHEQHASSSHASGMMPHEVEENNSILDPYRAMVLNLLGLNNLENICNDNILGNNFTIEDFLWCYLWYIRYIRLIHAYNTKYIGNNSLASRSDRSSVNNNNLTASLDTLPHNLPTMQKGASFFHQINASDTSSNINNNNANNMSNTNQNNIYNNKLPKLYSEDDLLYHILNIGGSHYFDTNKLHPFKYVMILFTCQRYSDGIAYLYNTGRVFSAVHIMEVCIYYGLVLPHLPLITCNNGTMSSAVSMASLYNDSTSNSNDLVSRWENNVVQNPNTSYINDANNEVNLTPTVVLFNYIHLTYNNTHTIDEVVSYVVLLSSSSWLLYIKGINKNLMEILKIKNNNIKMNNLIQLFLFIDKCDIFELVGDVTSVTSKSNGGNASTSSWSQNGIGGGNTAQQQYNIRTKGFLDMYFEDSFINQLLEKVADILLCEHLEVEASLHIYELCGSYVKLITELCKQLSSQLLILISQHVISDISNADINNASVNPAIKKYLFWKEKCKEFYVQYLVNASQNQKSVSKSNDSIYISNVSFSNNSSNSKENQSNKYMIVYENLLQNNKLDLKSCLEGLLNFDAFLEAYYSPPVKEKDEYTDK